MADLFVAGLVVLWFAGLGVGAALMGDDSGLMEPKVASLRVRWGWGVVMVVVTVAMLVGMGVWKR